MTTASLVPDEEGVWPSKSRPPVRPELACWRRGTLRGWMGHRMSQHLKCRWCSQALAGKIPFVENATTYLVEPRASLKLMTRRETAWREAYAAHLASANQTGPSRYELTTLFERAVSALELHLGCAAFYEALHELRVETFADMPPHVGRALDIASKMARVDVRSVLRESQNQPPAGPPSQTPMDGRIVNVVAVMLRASRAMLVHVPLEALALISRDQDFTELWHRLVTAYESLTAFVRRGDPAPTAEAMRVAGRAYVDGRLALDEVASLLDVSREDAVALLEAQGYCRTAERVQLLPEQRAATLRAIREERLTRGGTPIASSALVRREVIASQRIEGVDARPWLPRS
jgi:hypothetical protein